MSGEIEDIKLYSLRNEKDSNILVDARACNKPAKKLWFRGVRSSKFRHVYGKPAKRESCYYNIPITRNAHDSNFCAVNPKFVAVVTEVAGGGAFIVSPINKAGKVDINVNKVTGHRGPVLDVKWNPFNDNIIASCSDDCTIKLWYIPDVGLNCNLNDCIMNLQGHRRRVGYIQWHPTAENVLASAGFDSLVIVWDVAVGEALSVINCHTDVIHSISFNEDGSKLATTCKDKKLRIIDPRTGFVISEGICHDSSRSSKVVYVTDGRVITTGFSSHSDRQLAVWDEHNLKSPIKYEVIDSSSGILFPYFDHDTRLLYLAGKGDGNIRYYEVVEGQSCIHFLNQYISDSPQRGLGYLPKRGCNTMQCEIFRFYKLHTTRNICEPVSMIVPRKSDQFQDDLYPDTAAPIPALTASEWFGGLNKPPVLMSMKTGVQIKTHKPKEFKPNDASKGNINYRMKLAFLSKETIPDYRPLNMLNDYEQNEKMINSQNTKFQQIHQMFTNIQQEATGDERLMIKITSDDALDIPKNEYELQKSYNRQCEEMKFLRRQLLNRDRRIQDLERLVESLQCQVSNLRLR